MKYSLTSRTVRGLKWSYCAVVLNVAFQIAYTAIMARLIEPAAYGLVAMTYVVIRFSAPFTQMGLGSALIRKPVLTREDIGTAYLASIGSGIVFCVATWLLAPAAAKLFDEPAVVPLIRVASLSFIISAVSSISISLLRRDLRFLTIGIVELSAFVLGTGLIGISLAAIGFDVWSLILAFLCQSVLLSGFSLLALRRAVPLSFDRKAFKELFSFGGTYSLIGFLEAMTYSVDVIFISQFLNNRLLGIYNRASFLIQIPAQHLSSTVNKVIFPSFSEAAWTPARLKTAYMSAFMFLGVVLCPFGLGVSIGAQEIVLFILGAQWGEAVPVLRLLAIAVPFHLALHLHGLIFDVKSRLGLKLIIRTGHFLFIVILYYELRHYGLVGFASAFLITEILFYALYTLCLFLVMDIDRRYFFDCHVTIALVTVITCVPIAVGMAIGQALGLPVAAILATETIFGAGAFLTCFIVPPRLLRTEVAARFFSGTFELPENGTVGKVLQWYKYQVLGIDGSV